MEGEGDTQQANDITALILKHLQEFQRQPRSLPGAWKNAQQAEGDSTTKIFLNKGFATWFGYHLMKNAATGTTHFPGKAEYSRLIGLLENETVAGRELVAEKVASAIQSAIPHVRGKLDRIKSKLELPGHPSHGNNNDDDLQSTFSESFPASAAQVPASEHENVLVHACLEQAMCLFPQDLAHSIQRDPSPDDENTFVAAISLSFPPLPIQDKVACQMSLEVSSEKVQHLSWELFQVRLETYDGLRYILSAGTKILPNPMLTLTGCRREKISSIFGAAVSSAIEASRTYRDEVKKWQGFTDCVSMVISQSACESASIFVSLGLWEGIQIKNKLYG
ncbi:hypothetical protein V8F33_009027 [Rhypophila sp. PSN 637]